MAPLDESTDDVRWPAGVWPVTPPKSNRPEPDAPQDSPLPPHAKRAKTYSMVLARFFQPWLTAAVSQGGADAAPHAGYVVSAAKRGPQFALWMPGGRGGWGQCRCHAIAGHTPPGFLDRLAQVLQEAATSLTQKPKGRGGYQRTLTLLTDLAILIVTEAWDTGQITVVAQVIISAFQVLADGGGGEFPDISPPTGLSPPTDKSHGKTLTPHCAKRGLGTTSHVSIPPWL